MASDIFLYLNGIKGESADAKHQDQIDVESYSWGVRMSEPDGRGGGGGVGKATFDGLTFVAKTSMASPPLFLAAASGKHLPDALLTVRRASDKQTEYIHIKLVDVTVSSYQQSDTEAQDRPTDICALRFGIIDFSYSPQMADGTLGGSIEAAWDVKKNQKI